MINVTLWYRQYVIGYMAQRPTSLRDRTLVMDLTRNKSASPNTHLSPAVAVSATGSGTTCSTGVSGVSIINDITSSSEVEPNSDNYDQLPNQTNSSNRVSVNITNSNTSATARQTPSPSPSPLPSPGLGLGARSSSSTSTSRSASPKPLLRPEGVARVEDDDQNSKRDHDFSSNLTPGSNNQNRLSATSLSLGTVLARIGTSPISFSDSRKSVHSSESGGSVDSKDDKENYRKSMDASHKKSFFKRRKSSKDISKDADRLRVQLPENDSLQKSTASSDDAGSSKGQNYFHHSQSLPDCLKHEEAVLANQSPPSGYASNSPSLLSVSTASDKDKLSRDAKKPKKSAPWMSVLSSNYKTKCEEFKKTFKAIPENERLVVDYSCALQKDILVQGRMYVTEEWVCFYANILLKWETLLTIRLRDITAITKEKTIGLFHNAIQITTEGEKYFFTSFISRDKIYMLLFKVWQNALIGQKMSPDEYWTRVHANYGSNLGLCSDEMPEDYIKPSGAVENGDESIDDDFKDDIPDDEIDDDIFPPDEESQDLSYSEGSVSVSISSANGPDTPLSLESNIPLLRSQGDLPPYEEGEVSALCPDEFNGKEYLNFVYDIPVDKMAEALFADSHLFMKEFLERRGHTDTDITPWEKIDESDTKSDTRKICYTYNLPAAIGPKSCGIIETHTMRNDWCQQGHSYVNDLDIRQKGVPYCDYFYSSARQTLTRVSSTSCRLRVQCSLIYVKNAWGFVKNFIEKNSESGTKETHKLLDKFIRERLIGITYPAHLKKRKTRKRSRTVTSKEESEKGPEKRRLDSHIERPEVFWFSRAVNQVLPSWIHSRLWFLGDTRNLMLIICLVLILLSLFNISLFLQLRSLEDRAVHKEVLSPEELTAKLSALPTTKEEWSVLLQQQQYYHELELNKWKDVVGLCIQLIKQMESTLSELHSSLHPFKSMPNVDLKQAIKGHSQLDEL